VAILRKRRYRIDAFFVLSAVVFCSLFHAATWASDRSQCNQLLARVTPVKGAFDPRKPTMIAVNGYSTGRFAASRFRDLGLQTIHVHSRGAPQDSMYEETFWPETYDALDPFDGHDFDGLVARLKNVNIVGVVALSDGGVLFADKLSTRLVTDGMQFPSNGIEEGRKDKRRMSELLAEANPKVDSVLQLSTSNPADAIAWIHRHRLFSRSPGYVFIKPRRDASSLNVVTASSDREVSEHFDRIIGTTDHLGNRNDELLVQETLEGVEYIPNSVTADEYTVFTDIWAYTKRLTPDGRNWVYDYDELLPFEGKEQQEIVGYHLKVLAAHRWKIGPCHPEIKYVLGRGPVLVEANYRFMGSSQNILAELATGHSQLDRTALAFKNPKEFRRLPVGYEIKKHAAVYELKFFPNRPSVLSPRVSAVSGVVCNRALPSMSCRCNPMGLSANFLLCKSANRGRTMANVLSKL
jgi:biotin carboxylase